MQSIPYLFLYDDRIHYLRLPEDISEEFTITKLNNNNKQALNIYGKTYNIMIVRKSLAKTFAYYEKDGKRNIDKKFIPLGYVKELTTAVKLVKRINQNWALIVNGSLIKDKPIGEFIASNQFQGSCNVIKTNYIAIKTYICTFGKQSILYWILSEEMEEIQFEEKWEFGSVTKNNNVLEAVTEDGSYKLSFTFGTTQVTGIMCKDMGDYFEINLTGRLSTNSTSAERVLRYYN